MDAVPERKMARIVAVIVDQLGASKAVRVAVSGGKRDEHELIRADGGAGEGHQLGGNRRDAM